MAHKRNQYTVALEEHQLFSEFPPPRQYEDMMYSKSNYYDSEFEDMLQEERPGLLDISWVSQVRAAHKASRASIKVILGG